MRVLIAIFVLVLVLPSSFSFAQKKKQNQSLTQYWGKRHKPLVFQSNKKMANICPQYKPSEYPYQGIGLIAGDVFGLTYKLYITESLAFSMDGGIAAFGLYKSRYTELFNTLPESDTLEYFSHSVQRDMHFSAKVTFYQEGPPFMKGLDMYLSLGWQFRFVDIDYGYNDDVSLFETRFGTFRKEMNYMGPEANFGIEYAYSQLPMSAFMEVGVFYDIIYPPTFVKFQFGVGLRFIF